MDVCYPSDAAVLLALHDFLSQNPATGVSKLLQLLKTSQPLWIISLKRVKRLRKRVSLARVVACALVYPNVSTASLTLERIRSDVRPYHLPLRTTDSATMDDIRLLLQSTEVSECTSFYDRKPAIDNWYYQAYAGVPSNLPLNNYIALVSGKRKDPVNGVVLIMKNGPKGGTWESDVDVHCEDVARTIWWYHASGSDVSEVFGQREFSRFLKSTL